MLLETRKLTKSYRAAEGAEPVSILRDLDFQLDRGQTIAIVGPSGSGKSTLLNLVGAMDRADSGEILVEGKEVGTLDDRAAAEYRNKAIGFVFQLHHLLPQ